MERSTRSLAIPHDAALPETFLRLAIKIGDARLDHAAAVAFVRWPGSASPFFEDLRGADIARFRTIRLA
ncbi:MAG: hypothetical protein R3B96_11090 [Pirellulaceae bacterium]